MKLYVALIFLILLVILTFSCDSKSPHNNISEEKGGGSFTIFLSDPVETLDPLQIIYYSDWTVSFLIFESLVSIGKNPDEILPCLAESWKVSDGGKKYSFTLRRNIKFQDDPCFPDGKGRSLNADDIISTFKRLANKSSNFACWYLFANKIKGIEDYYNGKSDIIAGIKKVNDYKIEFILTKPYVSFLKVLATPFASIIPAEAVEYYGKDLPKHPVGTGPFELTQWEQWQGLSLKRNEHYWGRDDEGYNLPYLKRLDIKFLPDADLEITKFLKGESQLIILQKKNYRELKLLKDFNERYNVHILKNGMGVRFYGFSLKKKGPAATNVNLRKAIAYGFNRHNIFAQCEDNYALANSILPPVFRSKNNSIWYGYNISQAKKIIGELNLSNTKITVFISLEMTDSKLLEESLKDINLDPVVIAEQINYYGKIIDNKPDLFRVSMFPAFPDPEEYYAIFYSKSSKQINLFQFKNPKYDEIFERTLYEGNPQIREQLYDQLDRILYENVPFLPISYEGEKYIITPDEVKGLELQFLNPNFKKLWIEKKNE